MDYTQNGNLNLQRVAPKTWSRTLAPVRNLHTLQKCSIVSSFFRKNHQT